MARSQLALNPWLTALVFGLTLLAWEVGVRWAGVPVYLLPAPSVVLHTLIARFTSDYLAATLITVGEALGGLAIGSAAAIALALGITFWPRLEGGVMSIAILIKSMPLAAIAPLLTIWLGFGWQPKVVIAALLVFFPMLVNLVAGLRALDPAKLEHMRAWHANRWQELRYLRVPHCAPYFFAALKVTAPLALIGAVVAEWAGASGGLGRIMWLAYTNLNLPLMFAAIFILSGVGIGLYGLIAALERRIVFWANPEV
ncbi:MAG: ABC transporter permease [Thermoflexales bacterium]|nr:ABC transporter permease [Thermoflexales bacterium]MCS7325112.1 ABC transporter permease [Thermoflexales bacterium]MCX7938701.1 ABC transporter permease [Thermoflexales bacterium]MDW8054806.1 ABC transporter permease [Anaerolineae bacterium]MDW8292924.1 ABC transporter permease [Anaerolineae bacterium]